MRFRLFPKKGEKITEPKFLFKDTIIKARKLGNGDVLEQTYGKNVSSYYFISGKLLFEYHDEEGIEKIRVSPSGWVVDSRYMLPKTTERAESFFYIKDEIAREGFIVYEKRWIEGELTQEAFRNLKNHVASVLEQLDTWVKKQEYDRFVEGMNMKSENTKKKNETLLNL